MSKESLDNIDAKLSEMLINSMHIYDIAMNCLLGDTNLDTVRDDLIPFSKSTAPTDLFKLRNNSSFCSKFKKLRYSFTALVYDYVKRYRENR